MLVACQATDRREHNSQFLHETTHPHAKDDQAEHATTAPLRKAGWLPQRMADGSAVRRQRIYEIFKKTCRENSAQWSLSGRSASDQAGPIKQDLMVLDAAKPEPVGYLPRLRLAY